MVDAADLKSATSWRCVGSSPSLGTNFSISLDHKRTNGISKGHLNEFESDWPEFCRPNAQFRTPAGIAPRH